jgi:hypothetical protein
MISRFWGFQQALPKSPRFWSVTANTWQKLHTSTTFVIGHIQRFAIFSKRSAEKLIQLSTKIRLRKDRSLQ